MGGIIGLTVKGSALARWFLARPITARYFQNFSKSLERDSSVKNSYHASGSAGISRWNRDVDKIKAMFENSFFDPFDVSDPPSNLINFANGIKATADVEQSLTSAISD